MTRMEDMIKRYGECVTVAAAARIMGRSRQTVKRMIDDGRMRWAWPVGCADRSGFGQYQPGNPFNPRSASKPTCMPPRDYAGATPAGGDKIETGGPENYEAWPDKHGAWSVRFTGTLVWSNDGCMERCILLGDRRGVLGASTVGGKAR